MRYALLVPTALIIAFSGPCMAQSSTPNAQTHEKVAKSPHQAHGAATTMSGGSMGSMHMNSHKHKSHMKKMETPKQAQ